MLNLNCKIKPEKEVVITELEGKEAVILHLGTRAYFTLNETGLCIWQMLSEELTAREICEKLPEKFDVSPEKAEESVRNLIGDLINEKLVRVIDG